MDLSGPGIDVKLKERKKERKMQELCNCLDCVLCSLELGTWWPRLKARNMKAARKREFSNQTRIYV